MYIDFGSKNVWVPSTATWEYNHAHFIGWWWKLNKVMSTKYLAQCSLELPFREVSGNIAGLWLTRVRLLSHGIRKSLFLSVPPSSCSMQSFSLGLEFVAKFFWLSKKIEDAAVILLAWPVTEDKSGNISWYSAREKLILLSTFYLFKSYPLSSPYSLLILSSFRLFVLLLLLLPEALEIKLGQSLWITSRVQCNLHSNCIAWE